MKFRIWTILWVFALFASGMATFGVLGVLPAIFGLISWWAVSRLEKPSINGWFLVFVFMQVIFSIALPAIEVGCRNAIRNSCEINLRQAWLCLESYRSRYGSFPPAYTVDQNGQPTISWRFLTLDTFYSYNSDLHSKIHFDESWDSPNNKPLTEYALEQYQCPNETCAQLPSFNSYFAIVGPRTTWPGERGLEFEEIEDDSAQTIMLIEAGCRGVNWAESRALSFDEAVELLTQRPEPEVGDGHQVTKSFFHKATVGRNVLFADGAVRMLPGNLPRETASALLTRRGGEQINLDEVLERIHAEPHVQRICAFISYVLLSILPVCKLRKKQTSPTEPAD